MTSTELPHATVVSAVQIPPLAPIEIEGSPPQTIKHVAFCRLRIVDSPSTDSHITTEVWLPTKDWNGRYRGMGNDAFAGEIPYANMLTWLNEGYLVSGTDTGHSGNDPRFALGHPEKVKDFGWRAIHDMTADTKIAAKIFYGRPPLYSYFAGCSNGGREALMELQRFPGDYDGVLAGAPAYNWTALISAGAVDVQALSATADSYISARQIKTVARAVLLKCDRQDGVSDGIVADPLHCAFNPSELICKTGGSLDCLSPEQAKALKTIYSAKADRQGEAVFPGYLPGAEDGEGGWVSWIVGQSQGESLFTFFVQGYFGNFVHGDANWDIKSFEFDRDLALARERTGRDLDATVTDLNPFVVRGGKLVIYHGWNDPAVPALSTIDYYDDVVKVLGQKRASEAVRLYMVPGMQHCDDGPGPTSFGQTDDSARGNQRHDIFTALEKWVEIKEAPGRIIAEKRFPNGSGSEMTRPLCPYPLEAVYGGGNQNSARSFSCLVQKEKRRMHN